MHNKVKFLRHEIGDNLQLKQLDILLTIAEAYPNPVTYPDLQKMVGTTSGTVSRTMYIYGSKLEKQSNGEWKDTGKGIVMSEPNPYNTRQYQARLTAKGIELFFRLDKS